jgi:hypothetical protein
MALGAGCLLHFLCRPWSCGAISLWLLLYLRHAHLECFTDAASKLNDPMQTRFYGRHRRFFLISGVSAAVLALLKSGFGPGLCLFF